MCAVVCCDIRSVSGLYERLEEEPPFQTDVNCWMQLVNTDQVNAYAISVYRTIFDKLRLRSSRWQTTRSG